MIAGVPSLRLLVELGTGLRPSFSLHRTRARCHIASWAVPHPDCKALCTGITWYNGLCQNCEHLNSAMSRVWYIVTAADRLQVRFYAVVIAVLFSEDIPGVIWILITTTNQVEHVGVCADCVCCACGKYMFQHAYDMWHSLKHVSNVPHVGWIFRFGEPRSNAL